MKYIMIIDEGTTSVRSMIVNKEGVFESQAYAEIPLIRPHPAWSEQDPEVIWDKTVQVMKRSLSKRGLSADDVVAIGITNQRATNLLWDGDTGRPVGNAITWQDVRTTEMCDEINRMPSVRRLRWLGRVASGISRVIKPVQESKTGKLLITASKLSFTPFTSLIHTKWILENVDKAREKANKGELLFGTIDTWLIWKLTGGKVHATDFSNASATGMFDPFNLKWSDTILGMLDIPTKILPEVRETSGDFGETDPKLLGRAIPIVAAVADQQAALFGENCFDVGEVKCTHGSGTFIDMNTGRKAIASRHGLVPLVAWKVDGEVTYMLEGFVNTTGAAVQWLRDNLEVISDVEETEALAVSVEDSASVYFVPAFSGLSSPYWDPYARGIIIGLTGGTTKAHIVRAALEGVCYSCRDIIETMEMDSGIKVRNIKADGNMSKNSFLLQFMSDILGVSVERPKNFEITALGAAYLVGLATGYWESRQEIKSLRATDREFKPTMEKVKADALHNAWKEAVKRSLNWTRNISA